MWRLMWVGEAAGAGSRLRGSLGVHEISKTRFRDFLPSTWAAEEYCDFYMGRAGGLSDGPCWTAGDVVVGSRSRGSFGGSAILNPP